MGLVERPLALALVTGSLTGWWDIALPLGITLELFWLDVVAMGGIIQPFGGMAYLLLFPLCTALCWTQPGPVFLPLVLAIMAASLGSFGELSYRLHLNRYLVPAEGETGESCPCSPEAVVHRSILGRMVWHWCLYVVCYAVMAGVVSGLLDAGIYPTFPDLTWTMAYAAAMVGAVLSLRVHRAYVALGLGIAFISLLLWLAELKGFGL